MPADILIIYNMYLYKYICSALKNKKGFKRITPHLIMSDIARIQFVQ